jgi:hypothetical protein
VSPFISGFELQAHFLAGHPQFAIDLIKLMWGDFMLDDPRMTNSTFNEGYDVSGALHYPAYEDDARISHAHGWSTGPLIALSNYLAGLHVVNSSTWVVYPQPGNLTSVDAGFTTAIGTFRATYEVQNDDISYMFQTPRGTVGTVYLNIPACNAQIEIKDGAGYSWSKRTQGWTGSSTGGFSYWGPQDDASGKVTIDNVPGGNYTASIRCS